MKKLLFVIAIAAFIGCSGPAPEPQEKCTTTNSDYEVHILFEVDSFTVYRFYDHGHYHYFVNNGSVISGYTVQTGKTSHTETEEIQTVSKR